MKLFSNVGTRHYVMLAGWFLINVLQSVFTNLHSDEAYYWMYSKQLDWGFFDHPPMVALLVFIGNSVLGGELGVRLMFIVISTATMALLMNELNEKKDLFFLALFLLSFPLVHSHIAGFMALPDTPLVFFTLLLFLMYKRLIDAPNLRVSIIMAFIVAAMIYSKYHAFVVLILVLLSNLKLLKSKYFWITAVAALILLLPHIVWQTDNQFQTFKYHLIGRAKPIRFWTVQNNIISQLLVAGPLSCLVVFAALFKYRSKGDPFKKAAIFSITGFYIFFFIMSFKNRIEAHYTTAITTLIMILTYPVITGSHFLKKWFTILALPAVIVFFMARIYLASDDLPDFKKIKSSFYNHRTSMEEVKMLASGKSVASFNNYSFPGIYQFYTGDPAIHMATPDYRLCQYDLWDEEKFGEGDSLFILYPVYLEPGKTTEMIKLKSGKVLKAKLIPGFQSLKHLVLNCSDLTVRNDSLHMTVKLKNQYNRAILLSHPSEPQLGYTQRGKRVISAFSLNQILQKEQIDVNEEVAFNFGIPLNDVDANKTVLVFTQTSEGNRGNVFAIKLNDFR